MDLNSSFQHFFAQFDPPLRKLLLALSGGPDSMACLYLLLELRERYDLELAIAHVDHGWRKESQKEADTLKALAEKLNIPFFLRILNPSDLKGNLEEEARSRRLHFFKELCKTQGFEGVVLAHQAGDLAETVLKRILEGAHLPSLSSIEQIKKFQEMTLLRPLLNVSKETILTFLKERQISYFHDLTNQDPRFLRARMRINMFPFLEEQFGKNVEGPLCRLAAEMQELKEFMFERIKPLFSSIKQGPFGCYIDLKGLPFFEIKWFLIEFLKLKSLPLSYSQLDNITTGLCQQKANLKIPLQNFTLFIDRGVFFLLKKRKIERNETLVLKEGSYHFGSWKVLVQKGTCDLIPLLGWKQVFAGNCLTFLPKGEYLLKYPAQKDNSLQSKIWSNKKIPVFLRSEVPVITNTLGFWQDFLTGEQKKIPMNSTEIYAVSLYHE